MVKLTFVPQHQRNGQESKFTSLLATNCRVELFQTVYEQQGQQDDILPHLRRTQNRGSPFSKTGGREGVCDQPAIDKRILGEVFNVG